MENRNSTSEIFQKIQETDSEVNQMITPLVTEGLLTQFDVKKIFMETQASKEAIFRAIQNPEYNPDIQSELIYRLLERYQEAIFRIARDTINRQYTEEKIKARLDKINKQYSIDLEQMKDQDLIDPRELREQDRFFQRENKKIIESVKGFPNNHPRRGETIEQWLNEYQQKLNISLHTFSPKLNTSEMKVEPKDEVIEGEYREVTIEEQNKPKDNLKKSFRKKLFGR